MKMQDDQVVFEPVSGGQTGENLYLIEKTEEGFLLHMAGNKDSLAPLLPGVKVCLKTDVSALFRRIVWASGSMGVQALDRGPFFCQNVPFSCGIEQKKV